MGWNKELLDALEREAAQRAEPIAGTRPGLRSIGPMLEPIRAAPPLRRINGFGVGLYGWLNDPRLPAGHLKLYFLTALWIPILPVCAFTVDSTGNGYRFYHRMSLWNVLKAFRWRTLGLYATALIEGVLWLVLSLAILGLVVYSVRWAFGRG